MLYGPWQAGHSFAAAGRAARRLAAALLVTGAVGSACTGAGQEAAAPEAAAPEAAAPEATPAASLAIYALSRGTGVPEGAKAALAEARSMLEALQGSGADIRLTQERIGLEGETRLCAVFADPQQAEEAYQRLRPITEGVDLVNLTREPCGAEAKP